MWSGEAIAKPGPSGRANSKSEAPPPGPGQTTVGQHTPCHLETFKPSLSVEKGARLPGSLDTQNA